MSVAASPDIPAGTPARWQIARAIPRGSRRARSQRDWLRAAQAAIDEAGFRNQRRAHYDGVCRLLMRYMDWRARTSRPGHDRIAARLRLSPDTVARAVAWLRDRGLLGLVSPGTTAAVRAHVLHGGEANEAAVYVLTVPGKTATAPRADAGQSNIADLSRSRRELDRAPRAREATSDGQERNGAPSGRRPVLPPAGPAVPGPGKRAASPATAVLGAVPQDRTEALTAAAVMQMHMHPLGRMSARMVRHLARPYFAAGWTPADVLHAVDHEPGGRPYGFTAAVRAPARWIAARLAAWTRDGVPVASRSQQLAAGRARVLADQAARRAAAAAAAGQAGDYAAHGARARGMLAARPRPQTPAGAPAGRPHLGST